MSDANADDLDLTDAERDALTDLQRAAEYVNRGYGHLLECHHAVGNAADHLESARERLASAGHEEYAAVLRDDVLPAGVVGNQWTYELVEAFEAGFLTDVTAFEAAIRDDLADGRGHLHERELQREWRGRADGWTADGSREGSDDGE